MIGERNKGTLGRCIGATECLTDLVEYAENSIVSKTILDRSAGTVTLFAFDKGQKLSEHTTAYDAIIQVIEGQGRLTIGGEDTEVSAGQIIIMPADVPHAVHADQRFKMLLTMIRG
jgi:quercetin dioxygenase-like cupin family protein